MTGAPGNRRAVPPAARRGALLTDWRYTWLPAWRAWRRSRPFGGGLLLLLAGLELLLIPLSGVLSHGAVRLVVYIGIGGVFGVLIGILLITTGIAVWVSPAHRVFYGVAGVVLGIASFPASNLGGFFICMLLAIVGGSLAFAWAPGPPVALVAVAPEPMLADEPPARLTSEPPTLPDPGMPPARGTPADSGTLADLGLRPDLPADEPPAVQDPPQASTGPVSSGWPLAAVALPLAVAAGLLTAHPAAPAAGSRPAQTCILGLICLGGGGGGSGSSSSAAPSPTYSLPTCLPTALPSPLPSSLASLPAQILKKLQGLPKCVAQALPTALPTSLPSLPVTLPNPSVPGLPNPLPGVPAVSATLPAGKATPTPTAKNAGAGGGVVAPTAVSVITAGSATIAGFTYQGNAKVPTASGGTVTMMKFTASSLRLSGAAESITEAGHTVVVSSPVMAFSGNVVLYATKLSGKLGIIPLTFTPTTVSGVLLKAANLITSNGTITLTSVITDQAIGIADSLTYGPGGLGFSLALH